MTQSKLTKNILRDIEKTLTELRCKDLVRDENGVSQQIKDGGVIEISFHGKNDTSSIVYDKHITSSLLMDSLLINRQYTVLLYDKSIIQAEFVVNQNQIVKERLVFMKKHNKIWDSEEILDYEILDEDWFAQDFGIPIVFRVDYAPKDHVVCDHAITHFTISNHQNCRIPMKGAITFSEFVRFIMLHFYNIKLVLPEYRFHLDDTIEDLEQKMIHMNWK